MPLRSCHEFAVDLKRQAEGVQQQGFSNKLFIHAFICNTVDAICASTILLQSSILRSDGIQYCSRNVSGADSLIGNISEYNEKELDITQKVDIVLLIGCGGSQYLDTAAVEQLMKVYCNPKTLIWAFDNRKPYIPRYYESGGPLTLYVDPNEKLILESDGKTVKHYFRAWPISCSMFIALSHKSGLFFVATVGLAWQFQTYMGGNFDQYHEIFAYIENLIGIDNLWKRAHNNLKIDSMLPLLFLYNLSLAESVEICESIFVTNRHLTPKDRRKLVRRHVRMNEDESKTLWRDKLLGVKKKDGIQRRLERFCVNGCLRVAHWELAPDCILSNFDVAYIVHAILARWNHDLHPENSYEMISSMYTRTCDIARIALKFLSEPLHRQSVKSLQRILFGPDSATRLAISQLQQIFLQIQNNSVWHKKLSKLGPIRVGLPQVPVLLSHSSTIRNIAAIFCNACSRGRAAKRTPLLLSIKCVKTHGLAALCGYTPNSDIVSNDYWPIVFQEFALVHNIKIDEYEPTVCYVPPIDMFRYERAIGRAYLEKLGRDEIKATHLRVESGSDQMAHCNNV